MAVPIGERKTTHDQLKKKKWKNEEEEKNGARETRS